MVITLGIPWNYRDKNCRMVAKANGENSDYDGNSGHYARIRICGPLIANIPNTYLNVKRAKLRRTNVNNV